MLGKHPVILATPGSSKPVLALGVEWKAVTQMKAVDKKRFLDGDSIFSFQDLCLPW